MAGAVLHAPLHAQVRDTIPRRRDSTAAIMPLPAKPDSLLRDTLAKRGERVRLTDTVKAPLAHAELPAQVSMARTLRWSRDSLWATGALTVADLVDRVPGASTFHSGWLASPMTAAYLGDHKRVRVFQDGVELRELDPRAGGVLDLSQLNLWAAEDAQIEQTAEEIRVYLRTWRVQLTTPVTRTDIATGDQVTNLYRGFIGRRFSNGASLQFAAQQYGTTPSSSFGTSSDQLGLVMRAGIARPLWSVDGFLSSTNRHRGVIFSATPPGVAPLTDSIPGVESTRADTYVRIGVGDPDTSLVWGQLMASGQRYVYTGIRTRLFLPPRTPAESLFNLTSLDTSEFRSQYIASAGTVFGPLRLSAAARIYGGAGRSIFSPWGRASFNTRIATISAYAEGASIDSTSRVDISARINPLPFISLLGSAGRTEDSRLVDSSYAARYLRGEAGLRLFNLWLTGGVMWRDSAMLSAPIVYDTLFTRQGSRGITGYTAGIRGQLWRLIWADVWGVKWNDTTNFYLPRYQTRSELSIRTNLLDRFPSKNLGIVFSAVHEYRSGVRFPVNVTGFRDVSGYRTLSTLLEIRILTATLSWQFRNLLGERYDQVPDFIAPRQTNFYGIRWEFFN